MATGGRLAAFLLYVGVLVAGATMAGQQWKPTLSVPTVALNDGTLHPVIGFGTYKVGFIPASATSAESHSGKPEGPSARDCVAAALDAGYRFLDCAQFYGNEKQVGEAIRDSGVPRTELYLASKVWCDNIFAGRAAVRAQVQQTLSDLHVDYIDLYCVHWPVPGKHVEAYLELEACQREGLIRSIGISNYALEDYEELMATASVKPVINQIEINPFLYRRRTIEAFMQEGVMMQAYRALRDGKAFDNPTVRAVSERHSRTPAQILGRWCVQKGFIYIPKSVKRERMVENKEIFDFELTEEDMAELELLTTPEAIDAFRNLYRKCVVRDTPLAGTLVGIKMNITED